VNVFIAGGAGFVGSRIAKAFLDSGHAVVILDGLLDRTGASRNHVAKLHAARFIESRIEDTAELGDLIGGSDIIVDAMAWTCHRLALSDPNYDLALNLSSHLHLLAAVPKGWPGRIIFLGSRGQYGSPQVSEITEDTPQNPEDVQGIHKTAAESHFRLASRLKRISVASLRMPAIIGPNQPVNGDDIGLFGGFIRDLVAGRTVELYGENRRRAVIHVDDIAETVVRLASAAWSGFAPFNLAGHNVNLADTLHMLITEIGSGSMTVTSAPAEIAAIDIGGIPVSEARLTALLGPLPRRDLRTTLRSAIDTFRK
jgi:UDP-glucose 4-epimerase